MIPKIFHQTWKSKELPKKEKINSDIIKRIYSDYEYILWTDKMIYNFIPHLPHTSHHRHHHNSFL